MEKRAGLPSFHATTVAKLLVGDQPCYLEAWAKGHLKYEKRPREDNGSLTKWKADHTAALDVCRQSLTQSGWKLQVEQFYRLTGQSAILTGKPDVICQREGLRPVVGDVKTGEKRDSDTAQVQIYQVTIPLAWKSPDMMFDGEVFYSRTGESVPLKWAEAEAIRPRIFALLRKLGTMEQPDPSPSEHSCRYCEIPESICSARWKEDTPDVLVSEW